MSGIILKPINDDYSEIIRRWLNAEHVQKWFRDTNNWLDEIYKTIMNIVLLNITLIYPTAN
jgi:hypothetical protein